jgi:hypothetical protein
MGNDYDFDDEDEGPSGGDGGLVAEESDLPTIDSKSGRVMSKPRKSGSPLEWLLGTKMSGFGGGETTVAKKNKKNKKFEAEPEEEEYPEEESYDEELEADEEEDWDSSDGSRYAPINTKITITKVFSLTGGVVLMSGC